MSDPASSPLIRIRPMRGWSALRLGELWEFRDVARMLALRDVQLRYKQTALGIVWVILQPLAAALLFAAIFGRFAQLPSEGLPYVVFVLGGLLPWQLVSGIVQRAGPSVVAETRLLTKVYFPRLLVPLAASGAVLVDFAIMAVVCVAVAAAHGVTPGSSVVFLPIWVITGVMLGAGLGLWIAALNVRYRDFAHVLPFLLQIWLFATPVVYATSIVPGRWRPLFACNPMVGIVDGFRSSLFGRGFEGGWPAVNAIGIAIMVLLSGTAYFRRVEQSFADQL